MDIFGIGPLELLLIILLAIIIFGPKDIEKAGKAFGNGLRKLTKSETFRTVSQASDKIRSLPTELMREAGIDELKKTMEPLQQDLQKGSRSFRNMAEPRPGQSWVAKPDEPPADVIIDTPEGTDE